MLELEFVRSSDAVYAAIRSGHYVTDALAERRGSGVHFHYPDAPGLPPVECSREHNNTGSHGQQLHFLVRYEGAVVGAISAGAAVFSVRARDDFFRFPQGPVRHDLCLERPCRHDYMQAVVDNTLFRLIDWPAPKLATRTLRLWRQVVPELWETIYGVPVIGFETFVDGDAPSGNPRSGHIYRMDRWKYVGRTQGRTKEHTTAEGLNGRQHTDTTPKLIFCRWVPHGKTVEVQQYEGGWDWDKIADTEHKAEKWGVALGEYKYPPDVRERKRALRNRNARTRYYGARWSEEVVGA